ncbi:MAG TPA: DUF6526 family protein [Thermoanaerobaculia bacterium]|nr:DUF6526 family protein [Thermoanaerobaculia bacterium]
MGQAVPQNFKNHRRFIPVYHFVAFGIFVINAVYSLVKLVRAPSWDTGLGLAVAFALLVLFFYARMFALLVQDRVIRAEMRRRLNEVLPADLRGRIDELSRDQVVALRFASDAEIADLFREVLTNNIQNRDEIKKRIKDWKADYFRA